jgi:hypothetical protein
MACATGTEEGAAAPMIEEQQNTSSLRSSVSNGVAAPSEPMMDGEALDQIARDPLYKGLDVVEEAWSFKRYYVARKLPQTVTHFKIWLARANQFRFKRRL